MQLPPIKLVNLCIIIIIIILNSCYNNIYLIYG